MNNLLRRVAAFSLVLALSPFGLAAAAAPPDPPAPAKPAPVLTPPNLCSGPAKNDTLSTLLSAASKPPVIGDWTEYGTLRDGKLDLSDTMRISIISDDAKPDAPWLEVWMGKTGGTAVRMRSDETGANEMFVKMGSAIFTVPEASEPVEKSGSCGAQGNKNYRGKERVKTLAGTFDCDRFVVKMEKGTVELWSSLEVPGFNLVRMKASWGLGFELVAFGRNANSAFPKHFKANPMPLSNLDTVSRLMPGLAPPGSAPAPTSTPASAAATECDPSVATCPDQPPAPAPQPPIQEFDPKKK